jgi:hypothetical protein
MRRMTSDDSVGFQSLAACFSCVVALTLAVSAKAQVPAFEQWLTLATIDVSDEEGWTATLKFQESSRGKHRLIGSGVTDAGVAFALRLSAGNPIEGVRLGDIELVDAVIQGDEALLSGFYQGTAQSPPTVDVTLLVTVPAPASTPLVLSWWDWLGLR